MIRSIVLSCCALAFSGIALAGTNFVAEPASSVTDGEQFIAAKALWNCSDNVCAAELSRRTATVRTCKKVVKEIGAVASFRSDTNALSEDEIASCNASART